VHDLSSYVDGLNTAAAGSREPVYRRACFLAVTGDEEQDLDGQLDERPGGDIHMSGLLKNGE
jgi:hypothetical protein